MQRIPIENGLMIASNDGYGWNSGLVILSQLLSYSSSRDVITSKNLLLDPINATTESFRITSGFTKLSTALLQRSLISSHFEGVNIWVWTRNSVHLKSCCRLFVGYSLQH